MIGADRSGARRILWNLVVLAVATIVFTSCAVRPPWPEPGTGHPASPVEPLVEWVPPGAALRAVDDGFPSPTPPTQTRPTIVMPHGGRR